MPAKPKSPFPDPAATLPGEADILANVLADLSDHDAKLVYADWLEEHGDKRGPLLREFVTAYRAGKRLPKVTSAPKPWRDLVGITLIAKLRGTPLEPRANQLLALARPALTFKSVKAPEKSLPVGASKFGGQPDIPPNAEWPIWTRGTLAFLAQFNLADLAGMVCSELPDSGVLSVFYDPVGDVFGKPDKGGWRIFYFPDVATVARREWPETLPDAARFAPCRLSFAETITLPDLDSPWAKELAFGDDAMTSAYQELHSDPGLGHRLLGYPDPLQRDMLEKKTMRHLLTIDSDDKPGWMWGDTGLLYFTISESNLRSQRFDRVRFEFQCC